jgi:ribose/xylose/arabinose/galactoside ABC-type transport system permease subunit
MSPALQRRLPLLATAAVLAALYVTACLRYDNFFSARVVANLFTDNAALGIAAVGMTLVIFSGGIDLSVGAVVGFTSIFVATLVEKHHVPPAFAALAALAVGTALGAGMGALIHFFRQPAFLITLAGMFLMRGGAFWISTDSTGLDHPLLQKLSLWELPLTEKSALKMSALVLLALLALGGLLAHWTRFGRNLLALGGNESSARLMGLPVGATRIGVYAFNGFCAALAGLALMLNSGSGNSRDGIALELDAIAVVVIGGTLLSGGRGHMLGTLLGLLIFGVIQSAIRFDGSLDPAWTRIIIGALLLGFILLQRLLLRRLERR